MTGLLHASHSRAVRWTVVAYALCLSGATFNHLHDLYVGGWLPYVGAPPGVNAYWTGLTFLDPLAIALLVVRPRPGLILTLGIMLSDVGVNIWMAQGVASGALLAHAGLKRFQSMPWKDRHRFPSFQARISLILAPLGFVFDSPEFRIRRASWASCWGRRRSCGGLQGQQTGGGRETSALIDCSPQRM